MTKMKSIILVGMFTVVAMSCEKEPLISPTGDTVNEDTNEIVYKEGEDDDFPFNPFDTTRNNKEVNPYKLRIRASD